jgi:OPA family glycerol-3-phosphate transporter-like MFS transporter
MIIVAVAILAYWQNPAGRPLVDSICLIAIGFFIYGPVMLIGVHALDLVPKNAAGTSAGLTGLFGYFLGTALLANIVAGYIIDHLQWDGFFIYMLGACILSMVLIGLTWRKE